MHFSVPRFQRSLPALRQMTSDSTAFIHQSQLPLPCTQPSSTSAALTAMVLRPPLSTTTTASTRTPVVTLTQSPHCKAGPVSPLLQPRDLEPLTQKPPLWGFLMTGKSFLWVCVAVLCVPHAVCLMLCVCLRCHTDRAPAAGGDGEAAGDCGSALHGRAQRTTPPSRHHEPATSSQTAARCVCPTVCLLHVDTL